METAEVRGRRAYERRAWAEAFEAFSEADRSAPLAADDVERLAWAAALTARDEQSLAALERLHQLRLDAGEPLRAARAGFWLASRLLVAGETARASGWIARTQRLVERTGEDCVECGYLRLPIALRHLATGDYAAADTEAAEAAAIGDRFGEADLSALARNLQGTSLVRQGQIERGLELLDEAMVAATTGELSPLVTGILYCQVIATCQRSYALDRAREWTAALGEWCRSQPQLVSFNGSCLIHRSEIMQLDGAWPEAFEEARRASERLAGTRNRDAAADAFYQEGELHRLRGDLDNAERAYGRASELGRDPQPGLALTRLAQGRGDLAASATRRILAATRDPLQRSRFLPAHVEVMLAVSDLEEARRAADELVEIAAALGPEILGAMAQHARGAVLLAEGKPRDAVDPLRRAQEVWQRVGAPYLSARIRVLIARACRALGDDDGASLELDAARKIFTHLGAAPDIAAVDALAAPGEAEAAPARGAHGLSVRELEVLRLVAAGKTNKVIARELFVSEKTIDRHVSNIFDKLDVSSRAAATAWAYQNNLV